MRQIPASMRGVLLTGHGDIDRLEFRDDIEVPSPGPGDVLVRVAAAGVNNTDINTRTGWYSKSGVAAQDAGWSGKPFEFPRIQGADVCGYIVSVGKHIDGARVGERVLIEPLIREANGRPLPEPWYFGSECDGGFAEYTVVAARHAHKIDSGLSDVELASFPCSYSTAENLLARANVQSGEVVLVTGASGGVGSAAVQLAKARGGSVIGLTSEAKAPMVRRLGADETVLRDGNGVESLGPNTVDVVVDLVAGPGFPGLLDVLRPGGRYAVAGAIAGPIVGLDVRTLYLKDLSFYGCTVLDEAVFPNLIRRIENNQVCPVVAHTFALEGLADAQRKFMSKKHVGKIVLKIESKRHGR